MLTIQEGKYLEEEFALADANLERSVDEILSHHEQHWWVVLRSKDWTIKGYWTIYPCLINYSSDKVFELFSLWVHPNSRGKGLWKKLFNDISMKYSNESQIAITENELVVALWKKHWFVEILKRDIPSNLLEQLESQWALKDSYSYIVNKNFEKNIIL